MNKKKLNPILDPRGCQKHSILNLAERVTLEDLKKGKILFFNNTKLFFCNYIHIFSRIKERFQQMGINNFIDYTETVRGKDAYKLAELAEVLTKENPVAAIVAFGDMGVSAASAILTIALEKSGIPTVYITAPPGTAIAEGVAHYRAGNLCICSFDVHQISTEEEVKQQTDLNLDRIIDFFTSDKNRILEISHINFPIDKTPSTGEHLPIIENIDIDKEKLLEPGCYLEEINEYFNREHISDGLPIIPPTEKRFKNMMSFCPFDEDLVLCKQIGPAGNDIKVKDVAIAAIMAGCNPLAMPILITVFKALSNSKYNFLQSVTTSHPGGNLVLVSGPIAQEIGISGKQGCMGPGWPMNATIGRAVNLVILNITRSVPGICDLDCMASQAEFTYCFAEESELAQWKMINEEHYDKKTTTVYVLKAEAMHDVIDLLSINGYDLLDTLTACCTTLGSNNAYIPGPLVLCLTPDHGMLLKKSGFTKEMIREHIHKYAFHQVPMLRDRGIIPVRPDYFKNKHPMPVTRSPKDIEIVVVGGRGGHSGVILPWALHSEGIIEPVVLPNGQKATRINEFKIK